MTSGTALGTLAALAAVALLSGCLHEERKLEDEIERVTPSGYERVDCSFASGAFGGEPASESCVFVVRGTVESVAREVRTRFEMRADSVEVNGDGDVVEIVGARGDVEYRGRVSETPAGLAHFLAPRAFPPGSVGVVVRVRERS